ncbi:MAG: formylglycine-generating enzyme family protein, partial [Chromatiales bacterium]|nr:formylglycine-generating enzyme family protein [Chromatiales bacterium]
SSVITAERLPTDPETQKRERIAALLADAEEDLTALRLTSPTGRNAVEKYREVLDIQPGQARALAGLDDVVIRYIKLATGTPTQAKVYLDRAEDVVPGSEAVSEARDRLLASAPSVAPEAPPVLPTSRTPTTRGPPMVRLAPGCYRMGSPASEDGRDDDEGQHRVCVDGFAIGTLEVTVAEFGRFVEAVSYRTDAERNVGGNNGCWTFEGNNGGYRAGRSWRQVGFSQGADHPVTCVSWNDAVAYAKWLSAETGQGYRLPTEAEWEYSARAGTTSARHWGENSSDACRFANVADLAGKRQYGNWTGMHDCDDGSANTSPVGRYAANEHRIHDMLGNVWEWTCSRYQKNYDGSELRCVRETFNGSPSLRGGSWTLGPNGTRSADRSSSAADSRYFNFGFRVVRD